MWNQLQVFSDQAEPLPFWIDPNTSNNNATKLYVKIPRLSMGTTQLTVVMTPDSNMYDDIHSFENVFPWVALPGVYTNDWSWENRLCEIVEQEVCQVKKVTFHFLSRTSWNYPKNIDTLIVKD